MLLLIPRTATLGAALFLPVVASILLITIGIGFDGTVFIVAGMLLAAIYLLCWDADRVWAAGGRLGGTPPRAASVSQHALAGDSRLAPRRRGAGMALFLATRGFMPMSAAPALLGTGVLAAALVIGGAVVGTLRARQTRDG